MEPNKNTTKIIAGAAIIGLGIAACNHFLDDPRKPKTTSKTVWKNIKTCACKGRRTCALCINPEINPDTVARPVLPTIIPKNDEEFLDKGVQVIRNFLTPEEHDKVVALILENEKFTDSQSGRKKVDYGPRVNFRKKKIKLPPTFIGFPSYVKFIIDRLYEKCNFKTHEVLFLEYEPERGAHIDPHLDDEWAWGEQIINLNLLSPTVLTLANSKNEIAVTLNCGDLMVLTKEARHVWTHEIKQEHITEHRLCITVRDISKEVQELRPDIVKQLEDPTPYFDV